MIQNLCVQFLGMTRVDRRTVDLSAYPDLIVVILGMRVNAWTGLKTLLGLGPQGGESEVSLHYRLPGGAVRTEQLRLKPGWHTVILGTANVGGAL